MLDFAELEEFADLRLKNYSSGMLVRLAFAVMIQVDADILLIDEVLAVGDASFQQKCYDEFARLRREGRTVVLVTHDMVAAERFCDRALLLEQGRPVMMGDPHEVGLRYMELNFAREGVEPEVEEAEEEAERESDRFGDGRGEILEAWFEDADGRRAAALPGGRRCSFVARARFSEDVEDPILGFALQNAEQQTVLAASTLALSAQLGSFRGGRRGDLPDRLRQRVPAGSLLRHARRSRMPGRASRGSIGASVSPRWWSRAHRGRTRSSTCPMRSPSTAARSTARAPRWPDERRPTPRPRSRSAVRFAGPPRSAAIGAGCST